MLKKTIWILSIILVGLLSVSMISAIDNTTIDMNCIGDAETENQVILTQTNDTVGDFNELSELVENTGEGDTLKLYKDYKNTDRSNGIQIDKPMTVDGQGHFIDANHYSEIFFINAHDVTLKNIKFINSDSKYKGGAIEFAPNSVFVVENSSFANCSAELGGAIYVGANSTLTISGSNFTNCFADSGGAVYFETGSTSSITNSNFKNNAARIMGGSLLAKGGNSLTLFKTSFINSSATYESGGAFALIQSDLKAQYINVIECNSVFGGAITLLSSNSTINGSVFKKNTAVYDGGAIFAMYDVFNLYGNEFAGNSAKRGGALYVSQTNNTLVENQFEGNSASFGDAVYAMACNDTLIENNAGLTDGNFYRTVNDNLIITSTDFNSFVLKDVNGTPLPAYSLLDDYTLTPVKDQGTEGNCWAFATMAVLESCIVKASNASFDLSEANLKNLMALFSDYGYKILTNDGGFPDLAFGYFASWLGPIYEEDDFYSINDYLSPLLNTTAHIQNIVLLDRPSYTDNDDIKWAILRYGAVGTSMHFDYDYLNSVSYFYNGFEDSDHAVAIVGWDDNYSRNNFKNAPMGDGAWIVRNSWGPSWGDNGYFYVSYYDSKFAEINEATSYTFILNDTIPLNRNYQYEITFTSRLTPDNESNEACYKNVFTSQGDENLAAVSTYFIDGCDYKVSIYINDYFVTSKEGNSDRGYYTIYLDNMVGLSKDDVVTVEFNCSNFKKGVGVIPCSVKSNNTNLYLKEGVSYYWNGFRWVDFYSSGAVGCIKMFTSFSTQGKLTPYFQASSQKDVSDNSYLVTFVLPPDATGFVSINISGKVERINVSQTRSIRLYNLDESNNTLGLRYSGDERYIDKEMVYVVDLNSDKGNFDELKSKINVLHDGDVLNLTKDYCYVSGSTEGINILNSITIEGNGHIIDAGNQSVIFNIFANNTILKNIRFVGANHGDRRGALYLGSSNCRIINCSFVNNFASEVGGAIYVVGSDCNIINCSFADNFASEVGGAIIWFGVGGIIENCSFVNNSAVNGGAIWMQGYASVLNCSFVNNSASTYGGAIYWAGDNGTLANCCFVNNSASENGGAIYWAEDNGTLANCCFVNNSASNNGGAIRWSGNNANLIACEFIGNVASVDGGAIYSSGNENSFADSYFADNSASNYGGAIYLFGENCNLTNSSFEDNSGNYQIIWNVNSGNIVACYFIDSPNDNIYKQVGVNIVKNYIGIVCNNPAFEYKHPETLSFYVNNPYTPRLTFKLINGTVVVKTFATNNISRVFEEMAALKSGTWKLQAFFSGDDTYYSYDKTFTLDVLPAFSSLNVSLNNVTLGHETTISASVADFNGSAIDEGVVTFKDGDEVIGTVNVTNGLAELKFTPQKDGKHVIDATFTSNNYNASNAFGDLFVDDVVVMISPVRGTVGFNSTFAVEVTALYSNVSDGSVMFYIGNDFIGKKPVVNGIANMTYVPSVAGSIPLKVVYCESQIFSNKESSAEFIVDKAASSIVLNPVNGTVGREMTLTVDVSSSNGPINDGTVTFIEGNDVLGSANVENGVARLKYSPKVGGKHQVTARYSGNNYADSNDAADVYINDVTVEIIAEPGVVGFDSTFVVNVSALYSDITDGSVSFYVDESFIGKKSVVKGSANITYLPLIASGHVLKVVYGESQVFSDTEASKTYVVKPADSRITVKGSDGVVGSALTLTANVSSSNNQVINEGIVNFYDGDSQIGSADVRQGIATLSYVPAFSGNRLISAQFVSDNYDLSKNNVTVYIEKAKVQIAIGDADVYYDTLATVGIDISSNGKPINEGTVKVYVNNQQMGKLNVVDGHVEFEYRPSGIDALNVTAVFDETLNYRSSSATKMMQVNKLATNIEASAITEFYNDGQYLVIILKDSNGKAIGGERVSIDLDGVKYLTTDANGQVKLPTVGLKPKTYNVAITFDGSDRYLKSTKNVNVIVKKATPKLTASKKTFKRKVKVKKYTITLKNNVNKAIAKVKVTIKVKGKTFTAKTNSAGKATFKLKKLTKKGKYSATVTFKGDSCYNKVTKKVRITIK